MGYSVNFTENQNISAEDLNKVGASLSSDVTSFSNGEPYGVKDLNAISKAIITKGVSNGCNVSLKSGKVFISEGTAFFDDGKKMEIDGKGITLTRASTSEINHVWLLNDDVTGVVSAKCTTTLPTGDDYVKLAEISTGGTVTMKKEIALMKNSSSLPNLYAEPITVTVANHENETRSIDVGGNYRRMIITGYDGILFLDWDNLTGIKSSDISNTYDLSNTKNPISLSLTHSSDADIKIISYKNNILNVKTDGGYSSPSFTIYCM